MKSTVPTHELSRDAFLSGRIQIWQPQHGYRAGSDPVFLAAACNAKSGQSVLELGCGVGTASLCLGARVAGLSLTGIELQPEYAELAIRNADENGMQLKVHCGDLDKAADLSAGAIFDHVIMNPPYFAPGKPSSDPGRDMAVHSYNGLKRWIRTGLRRVRPMGHLTIIHRIDRLGETIAALYSQAAGLEIKPLAARRNRPPKLVIIRARKGSKAGTILHNPLILHEGDAHDRDRDDYTAHARAILRDGAELTF